ncbi:MULTISPECIES: uridine kinase [Brevibacillus]|uniref:uridine kinase n=1 Tax=Brevibacillus TaxID=55080 RepID=UPI0003B1CE87|nr:MULTISPECIES: uridine kinase [Brevibacillus]ERM16152.1 uridine kinase [Brevibacillus laterosporus PE36]MBA4533837.1 uridine kinase [Brevibacillus halotolerans]
MKQKPIVIAIAAVSGGGKTTVAKNVASKLNDARTIHFDDYDIEGPSDIGRWVEESASYDDWNVEPIVKDIKSLVHESNVQYIIVDYPFSYLNKQMKELIDHSFYIDTPLDIAMARRFLREPMDSINDVIDDYELYLEVGRKAYKLMENKVKPDVDYIIDGQLPLDEIVKEILNNL